MDQLIERSLTLSSLIPPSPLPLSASRLSLPCTSSPPSLSSSPSLLSPSLSVCLYLSLCFSLLCLPISIFPSCCLSSYSSCLPSLLPFSLPFPASLSFSASILLYMYLYVSVCVCLCLSVCVSVSVCLCPCVSLISLQFPSVGFFFNWLRWSGRNAEGISMPSAAWRRMNRVEGKRMRGRQRMEE